MTDVNLNSLRVFSAAARHLNFRRAADELNISHGAVSQRIKQLETELGTVLFARRARVRSIGTRLAWFARNESFRRANTRIAPARASASAPTSAGRDARAPRPEPRWGCAAQRTAASDLMRTTPSHPDCRAALTIARRRAGS